MKFLDKMKNLFTEEVEEVVEERPIKKEIKQVEIASPIKKRDFEEKKELKPIRKEETKISESPILNNVEKTRTPIYFDDKDFADLERPMKKVEEVKPKIKQPEPVAKPYQPVVQEKKVFKPSPIISPVYGVLDQNYSKDDIVPKRETSYYRKPEKLTIDDVRQKAFGTLEDELEDTLYGRGAFLSQPYEDEIDDSFKEFDREFTQDSEISKREEYRIQKENDYNVYSNEEEKKNMEEYKSDSDLALEIEKQKAKLDEINKYIKSNVEPKEEKLEEPKKEEVKEEKDVLTRETFTESKNDIDEINDFENDYEIETKTEVEKELDSLEKEINRETNIESDREEVSEETLDDGDLFNLIDSMYERGE